MCKQSLQAENAKRGNGTEADAWTKAFEHGQCWTRVLYSTYRFLQAVTATKKRTRAFQQQKGSRMETERGSQSVRSPWAVIGDPLILVASRYFQWQIVLNQRTQDSQQTHRT